MSITSVNQQWANLRRLQLERREVADPDLQRQIDELNYRINESPNIPEPTRQGIINMIRNSDHSHSVGTWWTVTADTLLLAAKDPPTYSDAPAIYEFTSDLWIFYWQRPASKGLTALNCEIRLLAELGITLASGITSGSATISVSDASLFPASGTIVIGGEVISYSGISTNDLTGCVRGLENTVAAAHSGGDSVRHVHRRMMLGNTTSRIEKKTVFDCAVSARWRNIERTLSDGWSAWGSETTALGTANIVGNTAYDSGFTDYDNDLLDGSLE